MSRGRSPLSEMRAGESLDQFHDRCLILTQQEQKAKSDAVDSFARFLMGQFSNSSHSVNKVIKGGSLGKGTAIRGKSDIDMVIYFNGFRNIDDFERGRKDLVSEIESTAVRYMPRVHPTKSTAYSAQFDFNGEELDILPAYDVLATGKQAAYDNIQSSGRSRREAQNYSASLGILQIEFVSQQSETVKRVIRLLKYWKNEKRVWLRSYTIELVTIYAAQMNRAGNDSTKTLFERALNLLKDAGSLQVAFDDNYQSHRYVGSMSPPYVLDPANPFKNTLEGKTDGISKAARETLAQC